MLLWKIFLSTNHKKMNNKKTPLPPSLPPNYTIPDNFCLFHKGKLEEATYTCPKCKEVYCFSCAKKAQKEGMACIKCKQIILI
jgi:hypothetical protein